MLRAPKKQARISRAGPQVSTYAQNGIAVSRQCKYGLHCESKDCRFKHPPNPNPTNQLGICEEPPRVLVLDEEEERFMEEFEAQVLHHNALNELAELIYYTPMRSDRANPYWIDTYPDLGRFSTWDDAFDALLEYDDRLFDSRDTIGIDAREEAVGPGAVGVYPIRGLRQPKNCAQSERNRAESRSAR